MRVRKKKDLEEVSLDEVFPGGRRGRLQPSLASRLGWRVYGLGFRVKGSGIRVQGLRFRV